jgi:hypothetical protein
MLANALHISRSGNEKTLAALAKFETCMLGEWNNAGQLSDEFP